MSDRTKQEVLREYVKERIDEAIEQGYIKAFYQPVARILTGEICGMEALARWDDPQYGLLSPAVFIPALEEAKLIHKLDMCIIEQICVHYAQLQKSRQKLVPVSFNLSRLDFHMCDIHDFIENAIRKNKLPRDIFHVEITESIMENNQERMQDAIDRFWESGLRVWMDDFGSGYSSLNVLKDYRFDTLKIDMLFLRDFDARSKEIIRSIVDMAKRIGVHTLAEGVETVEQLQFLRSIGCEKAQGYYIGKPMPYEQCMQHLEEMHFALESQNKKQYYHEIGSINILSPTPLHKQNSDVPAEADVEEGQISLAILEISRKKVHYLFANDHYLHTAHSIGYDSLQEVEQLMQGESGFAKKCQYMFQKARQTGKVESVNFVKNGKHCFAQTRHVASYTGGDAYLCVLQNISSDGSYIKNSQLTEFAGDLFSLYEEIEVVDLQTETSQNIYRSTQLLQEYNRRPVREELTDFAEQQVYPEDRERYLEFMDLDTVEQRLEESPAPFISAPFRMRTVNGDYVWQLNLLLYAGDKRERKVMCCSRLIDNNNIPVLRRHWLQGGEETQSDFATEETADTGISPALLWQNLVHHSSVMFFWKDRDRRFCGASRSFLDYYGIRSEEELIGKNDEEMGWHVDPLPFKNDEEDVLETGARTREIFGHCLNRGEMRKIVASKMPIYDDGKIVGIVGYFRDVTRQGLPELNGGGALPENETEEASQRSETIDPQTGMLNFLGIFNSMLHYQESYQLHSIDFGIIYLNIENFRAYNKDYGVEWGDALLRAVGQALRKYVGVSGVVARYSGDHFMVLSQCNAKQDLEELLVRIEDGVRSIKTVEQIPCTVYFKKGIACYSEVHNLQALYNLAEERARV